MTDRAEKLDAINVQRRNNIKLSKESISVRILWYTLRRTLPMLFFDFISFIIRLGEGAYIATNVRVICTHHDRFPSSPSSTIQSQFANSAI